MIPERKHLSQPQSTENQITSKGIAREEWTTRKDEGAMNLWNKSALKESKVWPIGASWELRKGVVGLGVFGIEMNSVWCESCLCGDALELANEALNGALWMGSYLQGFPFSVITKLMTAALALIEQKASRLWRQGWEANLHEGSEMATSDKPSLSQHLSIQMLSNNITAPAFSTLVTCINDAKWWKCNHYVEQDVAA